MKRLILTVGLPRSGKSLWAREQIKNGIPVLEVDAVWLSLGYKEYRKTTLEESNFVEKVLQTTVRSLFISGHDRVILCHPNLARVERERWVSKEGLWIRDFKFFDASYEICKKRILEVGEEWLPYFERRVQLAEPIIEEELREGERII